MNKNVQGASAPVKGVKKALTPEEKEQNLRLIELVKANPPLWQQHQNTVIRRKLWKAVASELREPVVRVLQRWKRLCMSYRRIWNTHLASKDPWLNYKIRWYAFEPMRFLHPPKQQSGTVQSVKKDDSLQEKGAGSETVTLVNNTKDDSLQEKVSGSEIVTLVNIRDNTVVCKSINEQVSSLPKTSLPPSPKPQTQVGNALRIDRRSQPLMKAPIRVKRTLEMPMEDPLQIKRTPPAPSSQVGATQVKTVQSVHNRSLVGKSRLNPTSLKSFLNLLEVELSELSSDYATMAQVDIYKIIGEYKLKDVRRSSAQSPQLMASTSRNMKVQQAETKRNEPTPVKIGPSHPVENNQILEVLLECEEDVS